MRPYFLRRHYPDQVREYDLSPAARRSTSNGQRNIAVATLTPNAEESPASGTGRHAQEQCPAGAPNRGETVAPGNGIRRRKKTICEVRER